MCEESEGHDVTNIMLGPHDVEFMLVNSFLLLEPYNHDKFIFFEVCETEW